MEDAMVIDCNKNLIAALSSVFDDNKDVEGVVTVSLHCCIKVCVISHSLYFQLKSFMTVKQWKINSCVLLHWQSLVTPNLGSFIPII
jgi:hypothetical protein